MITATITIAPLVQIEVTATMVRDDARGGPEWIMDDGPFAVCPRTGAHRPLVERYHVKAAGALADAANAEDDR